MRNSELLLFFFIIYSIIITYLLCYVYYELRERVDKKDDYIGELKFELEKARRK